MSTQQELVLDLKQVLQKYGITSAVIAVPMQPGEFFLMMHYVSIEHMHQLGTLLSEYQPKIDPSQLN